MKSKFSMEVHEGDPHVCKLGDLFIQTERQGEAFGDGCYNVYIHLFSGIQTVEAGGIGPTRAGATGAALLGIMKQLQDRQEEEGEDTSRQTRALSVHLEGVVPTSQ